MNLRIRLGWCDSMVRWKLCIALKSWADKAIKVQTMILKSHANDANAKIKNCFRTITSKWIHHKTDFSNTKCYRRKACHNWWWRRRSRWSSKWRGLDGIEAFINNLHSSKVSEDCKASMIRKANWDSIRIPRLAEVKTLENKSSLMNLVKNFWRRFCQQAEFTTIW